MRGLAIVCMVLFVVSWLVMKMRVFNNKVYFIIELLKIDNILKNNYCIK